MICIGTAFSDKQAGFAIATKIHKRLRNKILEVSYDWRHRSLADEKQRVEDDPHVDVPGLQIILLINLFSRTFCSLKEHHVAQVSLPSVRHVQAEWLTDLSLSIYQHVEIIRCLPSKVSPYPTLS